MEELQTRKVPLREIRTVPEIINASVDFFRLYRGSLGKLILTRALPMILFGQVLSIFFDFGEVAARLSYAGGYGTFFFQLLIVLLLQGIGYCVLISLVFATLKLSEQYAPEDFDGEDIWQEAKSSFWNVVGTHIGLATIFFFGFLLFALTVGALLLRLPVLGVIIITAMMFLLVVIWSLYYPARFLEECGFFESFRMSQYLVRGKFWGTAGLLITWLLLIFAFTVLTYVFAFSVALGWIDPIWVMKHETVMTIIEQVINVVNGGLLYLLYAPLVASLAFHYYSQLERKEYPSFEKELEMIGKSSEDETAAEPGETEEPTDRKEQEEVKDSFPAEFGMTAAPVREEEADDRDAERG